MKDSRLDRIEKALERISKALGIDETIENVVYGKKPKESTAGKYRNHFLKQTSNGSTNKLR